MSRMASRRPSPPAPPERRIALTGSSPSPEPKATPPERSDQLPRLLVRAVSGVASRIVSTTPASARVVVSPSCRPTAMSRRSRRMILPERVLGRSGVNMSWRGRAIGPILRATCWRSSSPRSSLGSMPDFRMTKQQIASPVISSSRPTTAASATRWSSTSALSISVVERRWPETFMTSSTRPISQ